MSVAPDKAVTAKRQDWLGRSLRKLYEDTVNDPLPESFVRLLEELDRKERGGR